MSTVKTYSGNLKTYRDVGEKGNIYSAGSLYWGDANSQKDMIYIPDEINEDTKIVLAINYRMSSTNSSNPNEGIITNYVEQYGPNIILIDPYANIWHDPEETNDLSQGNLDIICSAISDKIEATTGVRVPVVTDVFTGFSLGDEAAIKLAISASKQENYPPITIALFDPTVKDAGTASADSTSGAYRLSLISSEDYASLKNNGATIMGFEKLNEKDNENMLNNYAIAGKNGVKTIIFYKDIPEHSELDFNNIATDLYGYLSDGDAESFLNKFDGSVIYDEATGTWRDTTVQDLVTTYRNSNNTKLSSLNDIENCDNDFIKEQVNNIRHKIKNVSFLTDPPNIVTDSTTNIPSQESSLLQKAFDSIANVLLKLEEDTQNLALIGNLYENLDKTLSAAADNLPIADIGAAAGIGALGSESSGSSGSSGGNYSGSGGSTSSPTPSSGNDDSNSSDDGNGNVNNNDDDNKDNIDDNNSDNTDNSNDNSNDDNSMDNTNEDLSSLIEYEEYWPTYDELKTNDEHLVFDCDGEFKLVVYNKGEEVTGLEHYYKFDTADEAKEALDKIKANYKNVNTLDKILLNNNLVKVLFNKLAFMNLTVSDAQSMYSHLSQVK